MFEFGARDTQVTLYSHNFAGSRKKLFYSSLTCTYIYTTVGHIHCRVISKEFTIFRNFQVDGTIRSHVRQGDIKWSRITHQQIFGRVIAIDYHLFYVQNNKHLQAQKVYQIHHHPKEKRSFSFHLITCISSSFVSIELKVKLDSPHTVML